jgi:hypothetical protein
VTRRSEGWPLVGIAAVAVGAMVALILALHGAGEAGLRVAVRATARSSALLFVCAFLASALHRVLRNDTSAWLLRNRRYLGVSFAASHTWHLGLILALGRVTEESYDALTLAGGGLAYVFIAAMTATSFDRTAGWLGRARWRALHTIGVYYIWYIFAFTFLGSASVSPISAGFFALMLVALIARLVLKRGLSVARGEAAAPRRQ